MFYLWSFDELALKLIEVWTVSVIFLDSCNCVDKILSGHIVKLGVDLVVYIILKPLR
jgi:hypothetical protein